MRETMNKEGENEGKCTIDFKKIDITPDYPVSLLGYFNDRASTGVLDRLFCRILAIRGESARLLLIQIDTCLIPTADAEALREKIRGETEYRPEEILIFANHSHTAPALVDFYGARGEKKYSRELYGRILEQVRLLNPQRSCTIKTAHTSAPGLSHNRRWYMSDGSVMTNPPRGSGKRVRPEGGVDECVGIIGFYIEKDDPLVLLVSISNHTDTVGGTKISADWPGFMERFIEKGLGSPVCTLTLIAPQGNINHYEFDSLRNQTSYGEAKRIGKAYADIVLAGLGECRAMDGDIIRAALTYADIGPREIGDDELRKARTILESTGLSGNNGDLTAEDLETPAVQAIFARELVAFHETRPVSYSVPLQVLRLGDLLLCAIPGEPFVEIGLELRAAYEGTVPIALANGYFGYIPLEACFERGGYEVRQGVNNCLSRKAARVIIDKLALMVRAMRE